MRPPDESDRIAAFSSGFTPYGKALLFWGGYFVAAWLGSQPKLMVPEAWSQFTWGVSTSALLLGMTLGFLQWDALHRRAIGLRFEAMSLLRAVGGTLCGLIVFGLVLLLIVLIAGPEAMAFHWNPEVQLAPFVLAVATVFALSCMEEIGFRGYLLSTLVARLGLWQGQVLVALAFGLTHIAYGWPWTSVLLGVVPAGLLFGMAATASRGLAVPIGLHAGVNLAQRFIDPESAAHLGALVFQDGAQERVDAISPFVSIAVVLGATAGFWWMYRRHRAAERVRY